MVDEHSLKVAVMQARWLAGYAQRQVDRALVQQLNR